MTAIVRTPIDGWKLHGCSGCEGVVYVPDAHHPKRAAYCHECTMRRAKENPTMEPKKKTTAKPKIHDYPQTIRDVLIAGGVEHRRYTDHLPTPMIPEELAEANHEFARQYRLREVALERRRADMAMHRDTLTGIDERMKELADACESGSRKIDVECLEILTTQNEILTFRVDTGVQVGEARAADAEERQEDLFYEEQDGRHDTDPPPAAARGEESAHV